MQERLVFLACRDWLGTICDWRSLMFPRFLLSLIRYPRVLDLLPERLELVLMRWWVSITLLVLNGLLMVGLFDRCHVLNAMSSQELRRELLDCGELPF